VEGGMRKIFGFVTAALSVLVVLVMGFIAGSFIYLIIEL
jgi:hypothetical protein